MMEYLDLGFKVRVIQIGVDRVTVRKVVGNYDDWIQVDVYQRIYYERLKSIVKYQWGLDDYQQNIILLDMVVDYIHKLNDQNEPDILGIHNLVQLVVDHIVGRYQVYQQIMDQVVKKQQFYQDTIQQIIIELVELVSHVYQFKIVVPEQTVISIVFDKIYKQLIMEQMVNQDSEV